MHASLSFARVVAILLLSHLESKISHCLELASHLQGAVLLLPFWTVQAFLPIRDFGAFSLPVSG